ATVQAWRHSPSTKRMTVPLGPTGPAGPAGPGGPCSPFSPWGPASCFSSQAESAKSANSAGVINTRTCMGGALPRYPAGYGAQEVKIAFCHLKGSLRPAGSSTPEAAAEALSPPLRLATPAGNPFANAVSQREPDGQSHRKVKYQGRHDHRLGNNHWASAAAVRRSASERATAGVIRT